MKSFLFLLIILSACAGLKTLTYKPQPSLAKANKDKAIVYFLRERNLGGVNYIIFDGENPIGILSASSYFYLPVEAGNHRFSYSDSWSKGLSPVSINVEMGKIYFLQMDQYLGGAFSTSTINNIPIYKGSFIQVSEEKAMPILKNLLEIDLEKNKHVYGHK